MGSSAVWCAFYAESDPRHLRPSYETAWSSDTVEESAREERPRRRSMPLEEKAINKQASARF